MGGVLSSQHQPVLCLGREFKMQGEAVWKSCRIFLLLCVNLGCLSVFTFRILSFPDPAPTPHTATHLLSVQCDSRLSHWVPLPNSLLPFFFFFSVQTADHRGSSGTERDEPPVNYYSGRVSGSALEQKHSESAVTSSAAQCSSCFCCFFFLFGNKNQKKLCVNRSI